MFAQLGDVPFELLNSFTDLEETHEAQFAKHEVLQGRPRLQAMGNALTELKFGIRLHWRLAARTRMMDQHGRTAAREIDVELTEFVGDPNNPLPTPAVVSGGQNPLLAMLPDSVRGTVSKIADAVQTGIKIYRAAEQQIGQVQGLIQAARDLKNDPAGVINLMGDALGVAGAALGNLNKLPEVTSLLGDLSGAAEFAAQTGQAAHRMGSAIGHIRAGAEGGTATGWLDAAANAVQSAAESMADGAAAAQGLTAFLAVRGDV